MKNLKTAISFLALAAMTAQASAADLCNPGSAAALKTAAVQQELMVAVFTCNAADAYNQFVLAHQSELQKSDAELKAYFRSRDHGKEAGYDTYKTKAANLSALSSATQGARYCESTARAFAAAGQIPTLKEFVAAEHLLITAPDACAVKYDAQDVAMVVGPTYSLPTTPYYNGAAMSRAAYNVPASPARAQSGWQDLDPWDDSARAVEVRRAERGELY